MDDRDMQRLHMRITWPEVIALWALTHQLEEVLLHVKMNQVKRVISPQDQPLFPPSLSMKASHHESIFEDLTNCKIKFAQCQICLWGFISNIKKKLIPR